ncbi:MAG: hypothetical protein ACPGU5_07070 [Lishizhenia sp.]
MKSLLFFFCLLFTTIFHAQVLELTVTDLDHVPLKRVEVENILTQKKKRTNVEGKAFFKIDTVLVLEIYSEAYDSKLIKIAPKTGLDTLRRTIALEANFQLLETVEITSGRVKSSLNLKSMNVIDYVPYANYTLALVKFEGKRYLSLNSQFNKPLIQKKLYFWQRELELKEDCLGNVHVLTNDSSFQITIKDSTFHLVQPRKKVDFLNEFGSCFADFDKFQFYSVYELHDRVFNVFSAKKSNKSVLPVFSILDEETYLVSKSLLNEIVFLYNLNQFGKYNIISLGIWDGNINHLGVNRNIVQKIAFYNALLTKASGVRAFKYKNEVVVVDHINKKLHKANSEGEYIDEYAFDFKMLEEPWFMQDKTTQQLYALEKNGKKVVVYRLNLTENTVQLVTTVDDYSYPENIKFDNGWLYFLGFQNQFKKLFRIKVSNL